MRFVIAAFLAGCAANPDAALPVTIDHGIYGLTLSVCDGSTCAHEDLASMNVAVDASLGGVAAAATTSDDTGFFQLDLHDGTYQLCVSFPSSSECTHIAVNGTLVRVDWESGPGGGGWYVGGR